MNALSRRLRDNLPTFLGDIDGQRVRVDISSVYLVSFFLFCFSPVPDEPPQAIDVHLVNLTTITITWQPPSVDHINGRLVDYRILLTPASGGAGHNASSSPTGVAANHPGAVRNITVHRKDARSELIGNLTVGMRYRVTMAARTEAGLGVTSKPIYIRMGGY